MDKANNPKLNRQITLMDSEEDPIVEILRLAYRRGLAIRREQAKKAASPEQNASDSQQSTASADTKIHDVKHP